MSVFRSLLGPRFDTLAPQLRALHTIDGTATWRGEASIVRGTHPVARLCAFATRLPAAAACVPARVDFSSAGDGETWARSFGNARMVSRLRGQGALLRERLGIATFLFALDVHDGALHWRTAGVRVFGVLPLPARWFSQVRCVEREAADRYEFLVEAALPRIGPLIRYEGWLAHG